MVPLPKQDTGFFGKAAFGSILMFGAVPVAYLIRLLYARGFSVEEYGLFYAMIASFMLLSIFANLGTKQALGYLIPKHEGTRNANRVASASGVLIVIATTIVGTVLFLGAPWLEQVFFQVEGAALVLRIMTGYFIAHQLTLIPGGIFFGLRTVWAYAGRELYRLTLALLFSLVALVLFELTLVTAAIAWVVSHALIAIGYFVALRISAPQIRYEKPDAKAYKDLLSYGIPTIFVAGAAVIMSKIDTVMITAFRAIEEVAAYNVAYPTGQVLVALASPLVLVILPEVRALFHKNRL
ncbi:MAG: oligosaccharide flippase family protein, partial [Candidatus Woesearchaeota archaeon]